MIVIYWVHKHHKKHHKTYRFVRSAAFIGLGLSQGF